MADSIPKLSQILEIIQDTAFETHQMLESQGRVPLSDLEHLIFNGRDVSIETRTHIIWPFLIFTQPRLISQSDFQTALNIRLSSAEISFIVRQMMCTPPKIWSYRRSYQRGFAHTISGPNKHNELSIDACLSITGHVFEEEHLYLIGWTLSFDDRIFLISADTLTQTETYQIEQIRPFPLHIDDDCFWEENQVSFLNELYASDNSRNQAGMIERSTTNYAPEIRYNILRRILISSLSSQVVKAQSLQETVATESPEFILDAVNTIVQRQTINSQYYTKEELVHRLLQAIGCDDNGMIPCAHPSLIASDPVCLLLLPEDTPIFKDLHARDSIKLALHHPNCTDEVRQAFDIYQREKRWLAAFPCFDLSVETHAIHFGIPIQAIEHIFSPQLFTSKLPIVPQGDVLKQLQNKFGLYTSNDDFPEFRTVLDAISSRGFVKTGNMSWIARWIMTCCERYRYCLTQIEPDMVGVQRSVDHNNQKLLQKGLKNLASMFKK